MKTDTKIPFDTNNNLKSEAKFIQHVENLNPHLDDIEIDNLYHINLKRTDHNLKEQFGDVKVF